MPIYLRTGTPGAGKTCNTLVEVKARAEKENRPVYFHGIAIEDWAALPWIELENPADWTTVPDGAIIVLDEAQRLLRPRHYAKDVPPYVAAFETHRHHGLDVYIITQDPKLIDAHVRRLVGEHIHYVRVFGTETVKRHLWNEAQEDVKARSDSVASVVRLPKQAYGWYKSAEAHTVKARIPLRFWLLIAGLFVIPAMFASIGYWIYTKTGADAAHKPAKFAEASSPGAPGQKQDKRPALSAVEYVKEQQPRIPGLAYTAPVYDDITKPKAAPFPAGCVQLEESPSRGTKGGCRCYTEQGTRLETSESFCLQAVERGIFQFWRGSEKASPLQAHPATRGGVASSVPVAAVGP